jgi:hypothetical protein
MRWLASFCVVWLAGCGIADTAEKTHGEVQKSNTLQKEMLANIQKTSDAVHLQVLTVAMQQMMAAENTANLNPPVRMMPYAETFAKEATADELIRVAYVLWTDAQEGGDDRKARQVSLAALSALAGLAPDDKAAEILRIQIDEGGRFKDTAYVFALSRYVFIRDFRLSPILEKVKYLTKGALREAVSHLSALKALASLPYVDRLVLTVSALEVDESIAPAEAGTLSEKAKRRFQEGLDGAELATPEVQELMKQLE